LSCALRIGCALLIALRIALLPHSLQGSWRHADFSIYYLSGLAFRAGENPYAANFEPLAARLGLETQFVNHATDPPTFILLTAPLARLDPRSAFVVWSGFNLAALAAAMVLLLGPAARIDPTAAWVTTAFFAWYPPVINHFYLGQSKMSLLLALTLVMRLLRTVGPASTATTIDSSNIKLPSRGRDAAAGLLLAFAVLTRVLPLILTGYLVIERRWRVLLWMSAGLLLGGGLTIAMFGFINTLSFFTRGVDLLTARLYLSGGSNLALGAFISRCFWRLGPHPGVGLDFLRQAAILVADSLIALFTLRASIGAEDASDFDAPVFSLWVATMILLSPTAWPHYLVLLILPFANLATAALAHRASRRACWAAAASIVPTMLYFHGLYPFTGSASLWIASTLGESGFFALFAGWLAAYWFALDRAEAARPTLLRTPSLAWKQAFRDE
jgi:hypothetical protein